MKNIHFSLNHYIKFPSSSIIPFSKRMWRMSAFLSEDSFFLHKSTSSALISSIISFIFELCSASSLIFLSWSSLSFMRFSFLVVFSSRCERPLAAVLQWGILRLTWYISRISEYGCKPVWYGDCQRLLFKQFLLSLFHTHSDILLEFLWLQGVSYAKLMKRTYTYWQARFLMVASLPIYLVGNSQHLISGPRRQEGSQPSSHQYGEFASPPESCQAPKHQNLLNESQHNSYFLFTL